MDLTRIADLLRPFLVMEEEASHRGTPPEATLGEAGSPDSCHFEPLRAEEESIFLSHGQLQSISTYIDILLKWNARMNLSAIRDPEEIVTRHFGESLFAVRHLFPRSIGGEGASRGRAALQGRENGLAEKRALAPGANDQRPTTGDRHCSVADVGSGAGFPGLPFKIWAPSISLTLIESNQKKATFLREVTRALTLTDVDIENTRAESLAGRSFDVVTLRAVEHFEDILPVAASLVGPAGRLALLIGSAQADQARSILPGFQWSTPKTVPASRARILLRAHKGQRNTSISGSTPR